MTALPVEIIEDIVRRLADDPVTALATCALALARPLLFQTTGHQPTEVGDLNDVAITT